MYYIGDREMIFILHAVSQTLEMFLGVWILYKLYPKFRKESDWFKGIAGIVYGVLWVMYVGNTWDSFISNIFVVGGSALIAFFYQIFFKSSLSTVLCWEFLYNSNITMLKVPVLALRGVLENKSLSEINRGNINYIEMFWCLMLDVVIYIMVIKKRDDLETLENLLTKHKKLFYLFAGIEWCMLTYCMWIGESGFSRGDVFLNLLIIFCVALLAAYLILRILYQDIKSKNVILASLQTITEAKNDHAQMLYDQANQRLHDFKHTLRYLSDCISQGRNEDANSYINEYVEEIELMERRIWTGFSFLDFLLNYEKAEMDRKRIVFTLDVDLYSLPFDEAELGVVIGNLLDNAIEAAEKCEWKKRKISMKIGNKNEMFFLSIYNSSRQKPNIKNNMFITTKEDKTAHGLGVESVKRIVNSHDGYINFQYSEKYFQVDILI